MKLFSILVKNKLKNQSGAVAVEFALLAPLLLLILMLLVDFSRLGYVQISLNSAAKEGARASSFGLSLAEITTIANQTSGGAAGVAQISSNASPDVTQIRSCSASSTLGRTTEVEVSTPFDWITPVELMNIVNNQGFLVQNILLKARGVMVCGN